MKQKLYIFLAVGFLAFFITPSAQATNDIDKLQGEIKNKQQQIQRLHEQEAKYEESLKLKRKERITLSNQLSILTDGIEKTQIGIEVTEATIQKTNLEIDSLEEAIKEREREIAQRKQDLGSLVRWMSRAQDKSFVRILFTKNSFSEFYSELRQLQSVQRSISNLVLNVETKLATLANEKNQVEEKRLELLKEVDDLNNKRSSLKEKQNTKKYFLRRTRSSERQFAALLKEVQKEQNAVNSEILNLERAVRERLRSEGIQTNGPAPRLIWPIPKNFITTSFRDPEYPFRRLFEHNAIDVRAAQGTTVRAAASGYVARVRAGSPSRTWFMVLVHEGGLSTVYMHLSKMLVGQDTYVVQGQPIAQTGGLPGTPGAGPLSTGPHLHFEVRQDGVPNNPLSYLP